MQKFSFITVLLLLLLSDGHSQFLKSFDLASVRLESGPFYDAQQTDMRYMLSLDADRLLAPFLIDAGIPTKAERYPNWENTGLDGHIGGHYVSALAYMYAATGNQEVFARLTYMIDQLAACQLKNGNGYVGGVPGGQAMWKDIAEGKINADYFSLNQKWVPLYNIHKLFAGLRDAYVIAGNKKALDMLINLSNWFEELTSHLTDEQIQSMLKSEHGGMNEVLADVYVITQNKKYLTLAKKMSHKKILEPLLQRKDELTGIHANTQIPKVIGFKRIADVSMDTTWNTAARFFWQTVVDHRSVCIGGNSVREHFNPTDDFSSMIETNQGPETCNTYNMLRLTKLLFLSRPDVTYIDYYERALYNHILSSQHPNGGFVYFTPMRPQHYRVYSQPQESFWCCVGSGLENHGRYGELIYAHTEKDIYVNLFIPSTLNWKEKGITLLQTTRFPYEENTQLNLTLKKPQEFALLIRYPKWVSTNQLKVLVNGKEEKITAMPASYISIKRKWKTGDQVKIVFPMHTQVEFLPDSSSWGAILHGPIVLAAATGTDNLTGLKADDSRMGHVAEGTFYPIERAPLLINKNNQLLRDIKKIPGEPMAFSASAAIYPEKYKNVKLVPFFTLHDTRYMIYWKVASPENLNAIIADLQKKDQEQAALAERTLDYIALGEQQPEVDHAMKSEKTEAGSTNGQRWRISRGWLSYDLKNGDQKGKVIRVVYASSGRDRKFDILVNEKIMKTVELENGQGDKTVVVDYELPADIMVSHPETITIKFVPKQGSSTGRIFEVRLLN